MNNHKRKCSQNRPPKFVLGCDPRLTSNAGGIPIARFMDSIGFRDLVAQLLNERVAPNAQHSLTSCLYFGIIGVCLGARSIDQIHRVWDDAVLRKLTGIKSVPHPTTSGRIFKRSTESTINDLETLNHLLRERVWQMARDNGSSNVIERDELWIDIDSTVKTVFGTQEGADVGFNTHKKGARSYHPQLAFCAETKELVQGWLRCGSTFSGNGSDEFVKQLIDHLATPNRRLIIRGDSGYFSGRLIELIESLGHGYLIKVRLAHIGKLYAKQEWEPIPGQKGWEQAVFSHKCRGWTRARDMIAVRCVDVEKTLEKRNSGQAELFDEVVYEHHSFVTSEAGTPWEIKKKYNERSTCETWIEEAKNHMGLAQIKTQDFLANACLFQMTLLAYNVIRWMGLCSNMKNLRKWEPATVRAFMIRVAGRLLTGSRRLILKLAPSSLWEAERRAWFQYGFT